MKRDNNIYYWASSKEKNSGEGILANNFILLVKENFRNCKLVALNKFTKNNQNSFFYKYVLPFWGVILLWKYYLLGKRISYINFLPAWNFLLIFMLPPRTIIGPVTGSIDRLNYNKTLKLFTIFGIKILNLKFNSVIFSHDFFYKFIRNKKKYFFNFLLYKFKVSKEPKIKKYDIIFYIRKHKNKKNEFLLELIKNLSKSYKICVIGEYVKSNKNIFNIGYVSRKKAQKFIKYSKTSVATYENLFSYFLLDCLKYKLLVFYNYRYKVNDNIKTNLLIPINYNKKKYSINIIEKNINNKLKKKINLKSHNFKDFFKYF